MLTAWSLSDSNANQDPIVQNLPGLDIPESGDHASPTRYNMLEVKNGTILAGAENQSSYGVHVSGTTGFHVHGVKIVAKGIKSHTLRGWGEVHDCHLEVDMPWYFARENSEEENVILGGGRVPAQHRCRRPGTHQDQGQVPLGAGLHNSRSE